MPQQFPIKVVTPNTSLGEFLAADYIGIDDGGTGAIDAAGARTNLDVPSNADLTAHTGDASIHFTVGSIDHALITNIGVNSHAAIDTHIADASIHFTEASIDHAAILNIGVNTHAQIDTHIADSTIHFTEASIDHAAITNIGVNSHAAIDAHIADASIHFADAPADAQDYVRNNNAWAVASPGVTDHLLLTNIGVNSHAQIDTHIADGTIHFTEASIDHANITNIGTNSHAQIDSHIADGTIHFTEASINHANITNIGVNSHAQIDTHIADATIHFTQASIDHTAILNIGTNTHAQIDTHIADGSIHFADAPADAQDYVRNNNAWVVASSGVTDHTLLTNIGVNTHAQIDTHIADTDNPHDTFRAIAVTYPTSTNNAAYEILCTVVWPGSTNAGTPSKIAANAYAEGAGDVGDLRVYDVTNALAIAEVIGIISTDTANLLDMGTISNVSAGEAVWEVQGRETDQGKGARFDFNSLTIYL